MKQFYYMEQNPPNRKRDNRTGKVYTIRNGKLKYCCDYKYSTGSCRGAISEVFQALMANGYIPKKWETSSKTDWSDSGYFSEKLQSIMKLYRLYRRKT